jgi:predicted SnoaL-like aldol condensation-catalyzing enzyme
MKTQLAAALAALAVCATANAQTPQSEQTKQIATRFYDALRRGDVATIRELGDPNYIQHNPAVPTGLDAVVKFFSGRPAPPPGSPPPAPAQYRMVIAEGDKVMFLQRLPAGPNAPAGAERALIDIFRVANGKVVEHWDYMETFPRGTNPPANSNTPF